MASAPGKRFFRETAMLQTPTFDVSTLLLSNANGTFLVPTVIWSRTRAYLLGLLAGTAKPKESISEGDL